MPTGKRLGDDDWNALPDDVREGLAANGLERSWRGLGGPDVPAMERVLDEGGWRDYVAGPNDLFYDTVSFLDAHGVDPDDFASFAHYTVDCEDGHWTGTLTDAEGDKTVIDFGVDYDAAWDLYDYLDAYYDVECERGDIDYDEK